MNNDIILGMVYAMNAIETAKVASIEEWINALEFRENLSINLDALMQDDHGGSVEAMSVEQDYA